MDSDKVCRTLTLVANNDMTFNSTQFGDTMWSAIIPKGSQYEFNENIWGATTRWFLAPIQQLTHEQFQSIVDDTLWTYVKKGKAIAMALIPTIVEDDAHEELFSYCWHIAFFQYTQSFFCCIQYYTHWLPSWYSHLWTTFCCTSLILVFSYSQTCT